MVSQKYFQKKSLQTIMDKPLQDLASNFIWLKPLVEAFPDRVPSGFLLIDTILMLDHFLLGKLLLDADPKLKLSRDDKIEMARQDMNRIKKLMGALRYLWRNGLLATIECFWFVY